MAALAADAVTVMHCTEARRATKLISATRR